ncbi:MAG TPA: hypothetical protein VE482_00655, partial [Candidatus Eisenbacteria bacterium]|nr:hypothetical protein [Candidatus Eisenbacteria bacterium]
ALAAGVRPINTPRASVIPIIRIVRMTASFVYRTLPSVDTRHRVWRGDLEFIDELEVQEILHAPA